MPKKVSGAKAESQATYDDILNLPDNVIGEIIDGVLHVSPRPSPKHSLAATRLTGKLDPFGGGGKNPGGWWILTEPEVHLGEKPEEEIFVPDLAGWRKERMPEIPDTPYLTLVPDWVCEILSPSNAGLDRVKKAPKYAYYGVQYLWLIDPNQKTLEVFRLQNQNWLLVGTYADQDTFSAEPFETMEFELANLWGE